MLRHLAIPAAVALVAAAGVPPTSAQELVIDHLDGTATVLQEDGTDRAGGAEKVLPFEPIPGTLSYLNIAVDMANRRLADTLEVMQGVTDPAFVDELLIIPSRDAYRYWFVSFEEGDCYNPTQNVSFTIAEQTEKVTVRSQYQSPYVLDNSIREALLAAGECVTVEDGIEVCNEVLYGSEEADVSVKFPGWRIRHANPVRRILEP